MKRIVWILFLTVFFTSSIFAKNREIHLTVSYKQVNFSGKRSNAIVLNNQLPGPTLHFNQGDHVVIYVHNNLDKETAIHWHGILVPWQMDGVLGVTQQGIKRGQVFKYEFTLKQAGTYWYHAHAGLQEQQGLYGGFIIDPPKSSSYQYTKEYVIVLSDWINEAPEQVFANLKKDGDYYSPRFPLQASLVKFLGDYRAANAVERQRLIADYKMMQQMRMGIYDINDVAYDAFLLNGTTKLHPWQAPVKVGDIVRLRFIGASGETIFHVKIPDAVMQMVQVQGNDVTPYTLNDFTVAPGETYDVLLKIKKTKPYLIYAESTDKVGFALGALITSPYQFINYHTISPFPEPLPVTREMMANKMKEAMEEGMPMSHPHADMSMPTEPTLINDKKIPLLMSTKALTEGTKYQNLKAAIKTNDSNKPIKAVIKMELFGYMNHFIWMINGLPEYKAKPILLEPNKRYRLIFTNNSMMHHPMHIHGHWFILRNGHGAYDPLLHTIDVPPGSRVIADVDTDASGQWFFHCHMLYHMAAGMARTFQYSTLIEITKKEAQPQDIVRNGRYINRPLVKVDEVRPIDLSLVKHPMGHHQGLYLSSFIDVGEDPFHNVQELTFKGLYGPDYNKLELLTKEAEINKGTVENADIDIFYWHLISQFWAIKGGVNYFYRPANVPYWQPGIGIEGLMPYFIDTDMRAYYYGGSAKFDVELSRDTQITNNFFIRLGVRSILASKFESRAEIGSGLNQMRYTIRPFYRLMPGIALFAEYEHDRNYGEFKQMQNRNGESASEDTLTMGLSILF